MTTYTDIIIQQKDDDQSTLQEYGRQEERLLVLGRILSYNSQGSSPIEGRQTADNPPIEPEGCGEEGLLAAREDASSNRSRSPPIERGKQAGRGEVQA